MLNQIHAINHVGNMVLSKATGGSMHDGSNNGAAASEPPHRSGGHYSLNNNHQHSLHSTNNTHSNGGGANTTNPLGSAAEAINTKMTGMLMKLGKVASGGNSSSSNGTTPSKGHKVVSPAVTPTSYN